MLKQSVSLGFQSSIAIHSYSTSSTTALLIVLIKWVGIQEKGWVSEYRKYWTKGRGLKIVSL